MYTECEAKSLAFSLHFSHKLNEKPRKISGKKGVDVLVLLSNNKLCL